MENSSLALAVFLVIDCGIALLAFHIFNHVVLVIVAGDDEAVERRLMLGKGLAVRLVEVCVLADVIRVFAAGGAEAAKLDVDRGSRGDSRGQKGEGGFVNHLDQENSQ